MLWNPTVELNPRECNLPPQSSTFIDLNIPTESSAYDFYLDGREASDEIGRISYRREI